MRKKYGALRTIAVILKVLAWLVLVAGVLGAAVVVVNAFVGPAVLSGISDLPNADLVTTGFGAVIGAAFVMLGALIYFLVLYASAEMIEVGLSIEHNTRETAYYLRNEGAAPPPMVR